MQVEAGVLVRTAAQDFGPRVALSAGQRSLTFTELNELSNRVGSALVDLGVARGERVGVLAYNTPEVVETSKPQCCHSRALSALSSAPSCSVFMRAA